MTLVRAKERMDAYWQGQWYAMKAGSPVQKIVFVIPILLASTCHWWLAAGVVIAFQLLLLIERFRTVNPLNWYIARYHLYFHIVDSADIITLSEIDAWYRSTFLTTKGFRLPYYGSYDYLDFTEYNFIHLSDFTMMKLAFADHISETRPI